MIRHTTPQSLLLRISIDTSCPKDIFLSLSVRRVNVSTAVLFLLSSLSLWVAFPVYAASSNTDANVVQAHMKRYVLKAEFADVREDIETAITEQGLVINNVSHIGNMLARTGKVAGSNKHIFVKAEALEFCSASLSRDMMEADPHNIVFCPYIIYLYALPEQPEIVYIAYRRLTLVGSKASQSALQAVETMLDEIIHTVMK